MRVVEDLAQMPRVSESETQGFVEQVFVKSVGRQLG